MEGRVEIYCGQGRGKTSCAIGQCVKAAGQEKQIIMVQFLKGKETEELSFFKRLEPEVQLFRFEKYERLYEDLNEEEKKEQDHFIYNGLKYAHKVIQFLWRVWFPVGDDLCRLYTGNHSDCDCISAVTEEYC